MGDVSRVLSQANSEHIPSEESMIEIITPQQSDRSDRKNPTQSVEDNRMNASVHVIIAEASR